MLIDLHTHSNYSDGLPSVEAIEDHCRRESVGLALTDHNELRGSVELCERDRIPCLPGIEVGTREGLEFLVYFDRPESLERFYVRAVEPYLRPRFMVRSNIASVGCLEEAKELGAYVSLAHPFAIGRKSLNYHKQRNGDYHAFVHDVIEHIDAVELFNGGVPQWCNRLAKDLPEDLEKQVTVGSDAHTLSAIGAAGVELSADPSTSRNVLFGELGKQTEVRLRNGNHSLITLPVIAYKHTRFFVTRGNGPTPMGVYTPRLTSS